MSDPVITIVEYRSLNIGIWRLTRTDDILTQVRSESLPQPDGFVTVVNFDPATGLPLTESQPLSAQISQIETSIDDGGTRPWQTQERAFDAEGNLLRVTREWDSGVLSMRFETDTDQAIVFRADPADVAGWSVRAEIRDATTNALQSSEVIRDDNVYVISGYDEGGELRDRAFADLGDVFEWAERTFNYNEDGSIRASSILTDGGIFTQRILDDDGALSQKLVTDTADIREFEFIRTDVTADGGRIVTTDFDDGRLVERIFDANGTLRSRIVDDVDDAYGYARIEATYDETGALIERIVTPDPVDDLPV